MAYCTTTEVRNYDEKLTSTVDVTEAKIAHRIVQAENVVRVDLSTMISAADLNTLMASATPSLTAKLLTIYKSVELVLVSDYGAFRKADEVTDVQYFQKAYNDLLKKLLDGKISIYQDNTGANAVKNYPKGTSANLKLYPVKGVEGFVPDEAADDTEVDRIKE
jgi:hypothetical protein